MGSTSSPDAEPRGKSSAEGARVKCAQCGSDNPGGASFCASCGASLASTSGRDPPRRRNREHELYPEDIVPPTSGISAATGASILLTVLVIILVILMATGYNQNIPYLHPATSTQATIAGDRQTITYQYVGNGSSTIVTIGTLCAGCPMALATGSTFTYKITLSDPLNQSIELTGIIAQAPFVLSSYEPTQPLIVSGLSQPIDLNLVAPANAGLYTIPLQVTFNVA